MIVVDGTNHILGRLGSKIAKELLKGEIVVLVNADKIVMSGSIKDILGKYSIRRRIQPHQRPELKPIYSRMPHLFVKRLIRGMLPWKSQRGKAAYKRLKVYIDAPDNVKGVEITKIPEAENKSLKKYVTILDICKRLGYNQKYQ